MVPHLGHAELMAIVVVRVNFFKRVIGQLRVITRVAQNGSGTAARRDGVRGDDPAAGPGGRYRCGEQVDPAV